MPSTRLLIVILVLAGAAIGAAPASAGWLPPTDLAPAGEAAGPPVVAVGRDGTTYAAFEHTDGASTRIGFVTRAPGGGFSGVSNLSNGGENAFNPALAVDRQGNVTLAWERLTGTTVIQTRFHPAGGDWGPIQTVSGGPLFNGPSIGVADNGRAVVSWGRSTGGSTVQVEAALRPSGSPTFGGALAVSPNTGTGLCQPSHVAIDNAGDVAAIWTRRTDDGHYNVESAVKAAGASAFDTFQPRGSTTDSSPCNTDIQMTAAGRVTAVWDSSAAVAPDQPFVAYADRGTPFASGSWSTAVKLSNPAVASGQPHLSIDDNGNAAAIWTDGQLQSSVRAGLGGFTAPKPLSGTTGAFGNNHAVATSANGDAIAVFVGSSNGSPAIFGARRHANSEFDELAAVATTQPGSNVSLSRPDIGLDDQGDGVAVFLSTTLAGTDTAQAAIYDPVAPSIASVAVPGTGTAGQAVSMAAAASDRMSGVALHFDFGDGAGADGGAVGHIYGAAGAYTVTVTATDAAGNRSSATRAIQIAPAPPPAPGPGTGGGGGAGGGGAKGPLVVAATSALSYDRLASGNTRIRSLIIDRLVGPEQVRIVCAPKKNKGCRKAATRTIKKHGKKLSLTKYVKGMKLHPKATLTITVSRKGYTSRIFRYTMVKGRDPKKSTRCLAVGKKKSTVC